MEHVKFGGLQQVIDRPVGDWNSVRLREPARNLLIHIRDGNHLCGTQAFDKARMVFSDPAAAYNSDAQSPPLFIVGIHV